MINNFAFNPNPRIHKTNLVRNCNSTGNVKRINTNSDYKEKSISKYQELMTFQSGGQVIDYTVSKNNRVKSLIKEKKGR